MPLDTDLLPPEGLGDRERATATETTKTKVSTSMTFDATPAQAWRALMFYEEVDTRPPLHLRLLLPVPIRTEGDKSQVGGEALCLYEGGHLVKRATRIEEPQLYEFEIAEQELAVGGSLRLSGGCYRLREVPGGTEVSIETNYRSSKWPRWFWRPIESFVCHMFHRFLLRSMRRRAASS
jgi:hypothetical protein